MTETDGIYDERFSGAWFNGCCMALVDPDKDGKVERKYLTAFPEMKDKYCLYLAKANLCGDWTDSPSEEIFDDRRAVPGSYYKVVWDRTPSEKMIGFILPNEGSTKSLQSFAVTVDAVESATGLNFFSDLPVE